MSTMKARMNGFSPWSIESGTTGSDSSSSLAPVLARVFGTVIVAHSSSPWISRPIASCKVA